MVSWIILTGSLPFQARSVLEERNASLNENMVRLREEMRAMETRKTSLEQELRHAQAECTEINKRLSIAEASLEVTSRVSILFWTL